MTSVPVTTWQGCYADGWQGLLVSDTPAAQQQLGFWTHEPASAFVHPAKVSRALAQRLYRHLRDAYGLQPGSVVLDCFAGVAGFALDPLLMGYHFIGVELEPTFVALAAKNIAYWRHKFGPQPGSAVVLQRDSRQLREVLVRYGHEMIPALVSSPPYSGNEKCDYRVTDETGLDRDERRGKRQGKGSFRGSETYGRTEGQLGTMRPGALVSSPPYANSLSSESCGIDWEKAAANSPGHPSGRQTPGKSSIQTNYGMSQGQLGAMPPGALVTSPPYENSISATQHGIDWTKTGPATGNRRRGGDSQHEVTLQAQLAYSTSLEQLGNQVGTTFWLAASQIVTACFAVLALGAVAAFVVKPYVRDKAIVDFPGDWQRLCEQAGFVLCERIEASLVEDHGTETTLWGEEVSRQTAKKSFFRRLHERQYPTLAIDAEIVLIFRKPD